MQEIRAPKTPRVHEVTVNAGRREEIIHGFLARTARCLAMLASSWEVKLGHLIGL